MQDFCDTIKRLIIRIHKVEEGAEMQTKGIRNLFKEITAENLPTLYNDIDTHVQETFQDPNRHDQKKKNPAS
jgi:hypothetical protein